MITLKFCHGCKSEKSVSEFQKNKLKKDGLQTQCRSCMSRTNKKYYHSHPEWAKTKPVIYRKNNLEKCRARAFRYWINNKRKRIEAVMRSHRLHRYGITNDQYLEMVRQHNGVCASCKQPEKSKGKSLCVDHDHRTGKIRGLLCHHCNRALGFACDSIKILESLTDYLKKGGSIDRDLKCHIG